MKFNSIYNDLFTIDEMIAGGGFATIYRGKYAANNLPVAIKVGHVHEDHGYSKSIREEARILSRMDHRCVVKLYALPRPNKLSVNYARALEIPGRPYFFVMEFLAGETLKEFLDKARQLTVPEAAAVALEIARGLHHVHRHGYAHNDIKPENIVFREAIQLGRPFYPVLIDFGIATRVNVQIEAGSLYVMAPEQISKAKKMVPLDVKDGIDKAKVDVWGLGVLLYRMLGGRLPFEDRNEKRLTDRILTSRPTSLARLSETVSRELDSFILDGCLAKNPKNRLDLVSVGNRLRDLGDGATAITYGARFLGRR